MEKKVSSWLYVWIPLEVFSGNTVPGIWRSEKRPFRLYLHFHWGKFPEITYPVPVLQWCQFGYDRPIIKETNMVKYIHFCLYLGFHCRVFSWIALNLMGFTWCTCGCNQTPVKGTSLGEKSTSSTSYWLLLQRFFWNSYRALYVHYVNVVSCVLHVVLWRGVLCVCVIVWCVECSEV